MRSYETTQPTPSVLPKDTGPFHIRPIPYHSVSRTLLDLLQPILKEVHIHRKYANP